MNILLSGSRPILLRSLYERLTAEDHHVDVHSARSISLGNDKLSTVSDLQDVVVCESILEGKEWLIYSGLGIGNRPDVGIDDYVNRLECLVNIALSQNTKVLFISDATVMGLHPDKELHDEDCDWNQTQEWRPNGYINHLQEREIFRGISEGLKAWIIRPSLMIHDKTDHLTLKNLFQKTKPQELENGGTGIVSTEDLLKTILQLIQSCPTESHVFNCNGHNISNQELGAVVSKASYKKDSIFSRIVNKLKSIFSNAKSSQIYPLQHRLFYDNRRSVEILAARYQDKEESLQQFKEEEA